MKLLAFCLIFIKHIYFHVVHKLVNQQNSSLSLTICRHKSEASTLDIAALNQHIVVLDQGSNKLV